MVGNLEPLSREDLDVIRHAEEMTKECDKLYLQIAMSYGGRDEILRAVKTYAEQVKEGREDPSSLTETQFAGYLDTRNVPDIDIVIRTGGNHRLSNFFPWQTTYAELYFTDTLWPDFSEEELKTILDDYERIRINKGK